MKGREYRFLFAIDTPGGMTRGGRSNSWESLLGGQARNRGRTDFGIQFPSVAFTSQSAGSGTCVKFAGGQRGSDGQKKSLGHQVRTWAYRSQISAPSGDLCNAFFNAIVSSSEATGLKSLSEWLSYILPLHRPYCRIGDCRCPPRDGARKHGMQTPHGA